MIDQGLQWKVTKKCLIAQFRVRSVYLDRVKAAQKRDPQLQKVKYDVQQGYLEILSLTGRAICVWARGYVYRMWMNSERRLWKKYIFCLQHSSGLYQDVS